MITIVRKPGTSDNNREIVKMRLPNDNNPSEVISFIQRFLTVLGIQMNAPTLEDLLQEAEKSEEKAPIGFAVGGGIHEEDDEETLAKS